MTAPLGANHLEVRVDPTTRGPQTITIAVRDAAGSPVTAKSMSAVLSSAYVPSLAVKLNPADGDASRWTSTAAVAPLAGWWTLQTTVDTGATTAYVTSVSYLVW